MRLRLTLTLDLERKTKPQPEEPAKPSYGDGYMDNAGTLAENVGHPRMVGFQREDALRIEEGEHDRGR